MLQQQLRIAVVTRETRLEGMLKRWSTRGQARFVLRKARSLEAARTNDLALAKQSEEEADLDFHELAEEDSSYQQSVKDLVADLDFGMPVQVVQRQYLPTFDFRFCAAVVVLGQDGLVANTAKYALGIPIVGINPDPGKFDGVLLPFLVPEARFIVQKVLKNQGRTRDVTLAQAALHDGQTLLAFNDLFIGARSHVSARYRIHANGRQEEQSSSGILVCTGAGSTGWMSSVFNMAAGVSGFLGVPLPRKRTTMKWEDRALMWAVREPFASQATQTNLVMGKISEGQELLVESLMPTGGVIFSDGVESDFLEFNDGSLAHLSVAPNKARLVVK